MNRSVVSSVLIPPSGNASAVTGYTLQDEYGNDAQAGSRTGLVKYGWMGGAQRAVQSTGLQHMGARLLNPATGRFATRDAVAGGNENAYNYPNDPVNATDLDGLVYRPVSYTYDYRYRLGATKRNVMSAALAYRYLINNAGAVFPFTQRCAKFYGGGQLCHLTVARFGKLRNTSGLVSVWLSGNHTVLFIVASTTYFDSQGSTILFRFYQSGPDTKLQVKANAKRSTIAARAGVRLGLVKVVWARLVGNIRNGMRR